MSILNVGTSSLWSIIILISCKAVVMEFSSPFNMPNASLSILLYLFSALDRLLLANTMVCNMLLSDTMSHGQLVPFLVYSRPAPSPDASVSKYSGLVSLENFMHSSAFMMDFDLLNNFWYVAFQVHSVLTNVSCFSALHTSSVLEENLLR